MLRQEDSPFLNPGSVAKPNQLAIIQLSKDDLIPVYLRDTEGEHDGYKEGHVLNTRFGSFPHSTLIGAPWGSQIRASNVDTGSRGRKKKNKQVKEAGEAENADEKATGLKRKRGTNDEGEKRAKDTPDYPATAIEANTAEQAQQIIVTGDDENEVGSEQKCQTLHVSESSKPHKQQKATATATAARSGFVYILPPTPEIWTSSLPHRTQVVYTPDYSYILQRIRARPGSRLIEAGSGSGSFTHASARAVYDSETGLHGAGPTGKVFSFEFHEQRFHKMKKEISEHGLSRIVEINHRDVYNDGFLIDGKSPEADAVFLDLPAPWLALPHLSRRRVKTASDMEGVQTGAEGNGEDGKWISPLNPKRSAYICTFSPCIEQVTRTVSEMRKLGWVEIDMVEIAHRRINVHREKIGLDVVSDRGAQQAPGNVAEALAKLKEIEVKTAEHNAKMFGGTGRAKKAGEDDDMDDCAPPPEKLAPDGGPQQARKGPAVKPFLQGRLVTRPEAETKAHTSYLVFAVLPREWSEEDEAAAAARWPILDGEPPKTIGAMDRASRKAQRREMMQGNRNKNEKLKNSHVSKPGLTTGEAKSQVPEMVADKMAEDAQSNKVKAEGA